MLIGQRVLGISDNLLAAPEPGKADGAIYNLFMVLVFWAGIIGFYIHTTMHANESTAWVIAKLTVLAAIFATMVYLSVASAA